MEYTAKLCKNKINTVAGMDTAQLELSRKEALGRRCLDPKGTTTGGAG